MEMDKKMIGAALRNARIRSGLGSQEIVADAIGVEQCQLSRWERGAHQPSAGALCRLADLYQCSLDALLGRER